MTSNNKGQTTATIGEVCQLINGRAFKPTEWTTIGVPIIRIQNLNDETKEFNFFDGEYKPQHEVNNGDLLFSWSGTPGTSFGAFFWHRGRGVLNQHIFNVQIDRDRVEKRYFRYAMNSRLLEIIGHAHGGVGLKHITKGKLEAIKIPLPRLSEQKRIADILDKADTIRCKRAEELDLLTDIRSSAFLNLFGDPRNVRDEWVQVTLGEVTILDARMVDPKEEEYFDLIHIGPDRIEKNTGRLLTASTAREEGLISNKFLFDERYLLYSKIRPYLRKVALPNFKGLCSADVYPIRPIEGMATREFLFALLISEAFLAYTNSLASRASIPKLNRKELAKYTFHLPPIELQEKYSTLLIEHELYTKTFATAAEETNDLFNSLVQRAFKGTL